MEDVFIFDCVRTPRGRGKADGMLHTVKPTLLGATVLEALVKRNLESSREISDIIFGCVTQSGEQGACITKACAMEAGLDDSVPAVTLNRFCGSGLEAINQASAYVGSGFQDLVVAGGVESMSRTPMGSDGGALYLDPDLLKQKHLVPQGISADLIATIENFSREDVDSWAVRSQQLAGKAQEEKRFSKSIVPVVDAQGKDLLNRDETVRPDTTVEKLSNLKPSFEMMGKEYGLDALALAKYSDVEEIHHVHHAGNSSGIVDGAAAILLGSKSASERLTLKPRAKIKSIGLVSTEPTIMLTGPAPATRQALKKAGMDISDIDLMEVNEAFASVVLKFIREMNCDEERINVNGGAIALGHPLGATGAILMATLLDELERQDKETGLVTLCIGGGMGIATIIERTN